MPRKKFKAHLITLYSKDCIEQYTPRFDNPLAMSTFDTTTLEARQFVAAGNEQAHVVQFYTKDSFLLDGLCEFARSALDDGESVILVVSAAHRDGLVQRIKAGGVETRIAARAGRYLLLDAAETMAKFMDGNMPDRRKFTSVMGTIIRRAEAAALVKYRRVAIFGEMVALLWAEKQFEAAIRLEQLWNELAKTHFFYLRCAYPVSGFEGALKGEPYCAVCAEHSVVVPAEGLA